MSVSKTAIDRLGERLKQGTPTDADLRMLDEYRRSFSDAFGAVMSVVRDQLKLSPTGRPAKSTASIVDKLRRESIRLSQIQDIAGCRVVVAGVLEQETVVSSLVELLPQVAVVDRRAKSSHGYRAVHLIVGGYGRLVEVQVRTDIQHIWAEVSEKMSDVIDPSMKYGGGDPQFRQFLDRSSVVVGAAEELEREIAGAIARSGRDPMWLSKADDIKGNLSRIRKQLSEVLRSLIDELARAGEP